MLNLKRSLPCISGMVWLCIGCASTSHNAALDTYPVSVAGHTTVIYYDVEGTDFAELSKSIHSRGPRIDGRSYVGETRSPMRWTWRLESVGASQCSIREVAVSVNAQVTLPRWHPPEDAQPELITEWKRFLTALETHEAGHKDISAKSGREIINRLRGMMGYCGDINSRANEIARAIVEKASEEQRAYDATTGHGFTQGTAFRLPRPTK